MEIYKTPAVVHRGGVLDLVGHFICWGWRERSLAHVGCPVGRVSVRSAREGGGQLDGLLLCHSSSHSWEKLNLRFARFLSGEGDFLKQEFS